MSTMTELSGDYVLDPVSTRIGFVARHPMATRVRGQFDEIEGSAHLDGDDPSMSSAELTIQTRSIRTRNHQRDGHLRTKFLDLDNHPTITFTSTKVAQTDETNFEVTGDLTIRGVTKPVTVGFTLSRADTAAGGDVRVGFQGSVTINRKNWGVNWNAATGILVSEKVALEFTVVAIRRPDR
jgi:polyisoprenoid-binding protein YceI